MLKKIFIAVALCLMACSSAAAQGNPDKPYVTVNRFANTGGDNSRDYGGYCADVFIEKLIDSEKFHVLENETIHELKEALDQLGDDIEMPKELPNPDYIVKGSIDVETKRDSGKLSL